MRGNIPFMVTSKNNILKNKLNKQRNVFPNENTEHKNWRKQLVFGKTFFDHGLAELICRPIWPTDSMWPHQCFSNVLCRIRKYSHNIQLE